MKHLSASHRMMLHQQSASSTSSDEGLSDFEVESFPLEIHPLVTRQFRRRIAHVMTHFLFTKTDHRSLLCHIPSQVILRDARYRTHQVSFCRTAPISQQLAVWRLCILIAKPQADPPQWLLLRLARIRRFPQVLQYSMTVQIYSTTPPPRLRLSCPLNCYTSIIMIV